MMKVDRTGTFPGKLVSFIFKERVVRRSSVFQELRRKKYLTTGRQIHITDTQVFQDLVRRG